jgi:hypothetical protein
MNLDSDLFGEDRLRALVEEHAELSSDELRERIVREVEAFVGEADPHDDMTLVLLKVEQEGSLTRAATGEVSAVAESRGVAGGQP